MRKIAVALCIFMTLVVMSSVLAVGVELPIRVVITDKKVEFTDAKPFIDENGRVQTPARAIAEAMDADVTWDATEQKAEFNWCGHVLVLQVNSRDYVIDGIKKQMDTIAIIKDGRIYVPARYIGESFGYSVSWDDAIKTVYMKITKYVKKTEGVRIVAGFTVPNNTDLAVYSDSHSDSVDAYFTIDFLMPDTVEQQKNDLEAILKQRLDESTVKQIMGCIRPKMKSRDTIEEKTFFDKKTGQYIYLRKSWPLDDSTIELQMYKKGVTLN